MGHTCAPPRLIRSSVKDLVSCFYACRFPLEDELDNRSSRQPMMPEESPMKKGHEGTSINPQKGGDQNQSDQRPNSSEISHCSRVVEPRFAEEDYIVFRFRENGEIHMIGEGGQSHDMCANTTAETTKLRPVARKLRESIELMWDATRGVMVNPENNRIFLPNVNKDEEEKGRPQVVIKNGATHHHRGGLESCGSNLSDSSSASSFTFPELGVEWIGSPVHLPKEEKCVEPSSSCVGIPCFRF